MKVIILLWLLLLVSPVFGELTKEDIEAIRTIVKEEVTASEKRTREYIDLKIDGVEKSLNSRIDGLDKSLNAKIEGLDKQLGRMWAVVIAIIGLITAAIAIPQLVIAYKERGRKDIEQRQSDLEAAIQQLREQLNTTKSPSS